MDTIWNVTSNVFNDQSSIIRNNTDDNDLDSIMQELRRIKAELNPNGSLWEAIENLQIALKTRDDRKVKSVVKHYATDFFSAFFSAIASNALIQFINGFK